MPNPGSRFKDRSYSRDYVDNLYDLSRKRAAYQPPAERGAKPGKTYPVGPPVRDLRDRRGPIPTVPWTDKDTDALNRAKKHNPALGGKGVPSFLRKAPGLGLKGPGGLLRRVNPFGNAIDMVDFIDGVSRKPMPTVPAPGSQGYVTVACYAVPYLGGTPYNRPDSHYGITNGHQSVNCGLAGQSAAGIPALPVDVSGRTGKFTVLIAVSNNGVTRYRWQQKWFYDVPVGVVMPNPASISVPTSPWPQRDPNIQRRLPGAFSPPLAGSPHPEVGLMPGPAPANAPDVNDTGYIFGPPSVPPRGRSPENPPGEKEQKFMPASRRLGAALFKALDGVSETAEVVDCIYQSLPPATKKRWEKDRSRPKKGLSIDNAGQYGIDGADWKAQAVYHNADKIDMNSAAKCIFINHLEDKLVGGIHAKLPVQTGGALDPSFMQLDKLLSMVEGLI